MLLRNNIKRGFVLVFLFISCSLVGQKGLREQDFFFKINGSYNPGFIASSYKMNLGLYGKIGRLQSDEESLYGGLYFEYCLGDHHGLALNSYILRELDYAYMINSIGYAYNIQFKNKPLRLGIGINVGAKSINHYGVTFDFKEPDTVSNIVNRNQTQAYLDFGLSLWIKNTYSVGLFGRNLIPFKNYDSGYNQFTDNFSYHNAPIIGVNIGMDPLNRIDSTVNRLAFQINLMAGAILWDQKDPNISGLSIKPALDLLLGLNINNIFTPQLGFKYNDTRFGIVIGASARVFRGLNLGLTYNVLIKDQVVYSKGSIDFYLGFYISHKNRIPVFKKI